MIRLFFDTETTGLPKRFGAKPEDLDAWSTARLVQLSWIVDQDGYEIGFGDLIIIPDGFEIPAEATKIHGITQMEAMAKGVELKKAIYYFLGAARMADIIIGHNVEFDLGVTGAELIRTWGKNYMTGLVVEDTMKSSTNLCQIPKKSGAGFKYPKLMELYVKLFGSDFQDAHNSLNDVTATRECYWEMKRRGII